MTEGVSRVMPVEVHDPEVAPVLHIRMIGRLPQDLRGTLATSRLGLLAHRAEIADVRQDSHRLRKGLLADVLVAQVLPRLEAPGVR